MAMRQIIQLTLIIAFLVCPGHGQDKIVWFFDLDSAIAAAKKENKPLMIDFMADWCAPCKEMERSTFSNSTVILKAKAFIPVRIDIDKRRQVAEKYNALARAYGGVGIPNMLFLSSNGIKIKHIVGFHTARQLLPIMDSVLKSTSQNRSAR
jgi:thiol:disulfide interchange protein